MRTRLAQQATAVSRRVYASLPWGFRVAALLSKFAVDMQEAFGKVCYAEFLKAGVTGLPEINGQDALAFRSVVQGPRGTDRLPRGYGKAFGEKVWRTALRKLLNPETVEEAIGKVMVRIVSGDIKVREGASLQQAEALIFTAVINAGVDVGRFNVRRKDVNRQDDGADFDATDPNAFKAIERMLPQREMDQILKGLEHINERASDWVRAQLDGLTNTELAAEWGTSIGYISKWERTFLPRIQTVFRKHLQDAA